MNKRYLNHVWKKFKLISPWYFSALTLIFGILSVYGLRQNNLEMVRLREAVYEADAKGGDVETSLRSLRQHVYAHMNTDLTAGNFAIYPPIQLKNTYERLLLAEGKRVAEANEKIFNDANADCERRFPGITDRERTPCVGQYIEQHGAKEKPVPESLYKFDFLSPDWSPDLAGWSLVITAVSAALFFIRLLVGRWFKAELQ